MPGFLPPEFPHFADFKLHNWLRRLRKFGRKNALEKKIKERSWFRKSTKSAKKANKSKGRKELPGLIWMPLKKGSLLSGEHPIGILYGF
jgi:hypothetical protein